MYIDGFSVATKSISGIGSISNSYTNIVVGQDATWVYTAGTHTQTRVDEVSVVSHSGSV
jgi:hypothetical protein